MYILDSVPARNKFVPVVAMASNPYAIPLLWKWYVSNLEQIEQTVVSGLYRALYRGKPLDTEALLEEIRGTVPLSVSRGEDVARLREMAERRFVSVR